MLSIVIPAYNEESGISEIAKRVLETEAALSAVGVDDLSAQQHEEVCLQAALAAIVRKASDKGDKRLLNAVFGVRLLKQLSPGETQ